MRRKITKKIQHEQKNSKKSAKNLHNSKKSSTFAPAFEQHGGHSSVGRASDCGSECRGFEPHSPPRSVLPTEREKRPPPKRVEVLTKRVLWALFSCIAAVFIFLTFHSPLSTLHSSLFTRVHARSYYIYNISIVPQPPSNRPNSPNGRILYFYAKNP